MNIIKGDIVLVLNGKDRAKTGKVVLIDPKSSKALVEGVNVYKKHVKPSKKYPQGGIIDVNARISLSNLMVICPSCKKATKVNAKNLRKEKRRVCKKCGEVISAA